MWPIRLELRVGAAVARFNLPSLASGRQHDELFVIPTSRRAVVEVGPARTVRGDPLGLLRREVAWTGVTELFVHPRIVGLDPLGSGLLRDLEGQSSNDISMSDLAFHTLRDYAAGDDRRYIHWRTSARTGQLMVRQFVDTRRIHATIGRRRRSGQLRDRGGVRACPFGGRFDCGAGDPGRAAGQHHRLARGRRPTAPFSRSSTA